MAPRMSVVVAMFIESLELALVGGPVGLGCGRGGARMAAEETPTAPDAQPEPERSDGPAVQGSAPAPGPSSAEERGGIRWIEGAADADANVGWGGGLGW